MNNEIKIVPAEERYIDSFTNTLDTVAKEGKYLAMTKAPPVEHMRSFVLGLIEDNDIQFYAVLNDEVIGWCDIVRRQRKMFKHTGALGMGILKEYRGKGIGKKLVIESLKQAKANSLEKVVLEVFASNINAVKLYENLGFITEGVKKKEKKFNGEYDDTIVMGLFL